MIAFAGRKYVTAYFFLGTAESSNRFLGANCWPSISTVRLGKRRILRPEGPAPFYHGESMARQYDDEPEDDDAIHVEDEIDLDQPVNTGGSHQGGPWPWY